MEEESNNVGDDHIESPLPILNTIWDCPMMNKVLIPGPGGSMVWVGPVVGVQWVEPLLKGTVRQELWHMLPKFPV